MVVASKLGGGFDRSCDDMYRDVCSRDSMGGCDFCGEDVCMLGAKIKNTRIK